MHDFEDNLITYCGFIAIVGRPNVGKSTLVNRIIGEKISITANKPQTTRHKIFGIKTLADKQIVYIDTPGLHLNYQKALNKEMNRQASSSLSDVDAILLVIEALKFTPEDANVLAKIQKTNIPCLLVVNKVDTVTNKAKLLPFLQNIATKHPFHQIIPISAFTGDQVEIVEHEVVKLLPKSVFFFDELSKTDKNIKFRLAEIVREKLTRILADELPYAITVQIEHIDNSNPEKIKVHAIIWVERDSQKSIVIGKQGGNLKEIGTQARLDMNNLLKTRVHLQLHVKVKNSWSSNVRDLRNLGYLDLD